MLETHLPKKESTRTIVGPLPQEILQQQEKQRLLDTQLEQDSLDVVIKGESVSPELFRLRCLGNAFVKEWSTSSRGPSRNAEDVSKRLKDDENQSIPLMDGLKWHDTKSSGRDELKNDADEDKAGVSWRQMGSKGGIMSPLSGEETGGGNSYNVNDIMSGPSASPSERSKEYTEAELRNNPMLRRLQFVLRRIKTAEAIYHKALYQMTRQPRSAAQRLEELFLLEQLKTILFVGRRFNIVKRIEDLLEAANEAKIQNTPYLANCQSGARQNSVNATLLKNANLSATTLPAEKFDKGSQRILQKEPKVNLQDVGKEMTNIQSDFLFSRSDLKKNDFELSALAQLTQSLKEHSDYVESIVHDDVKKSLLHHNWNYTDSESNFREICWLIESLDLNAGLHSFSEDEMPFLPSLETLGEKEKEDSGVPVNEKSNGKKTSLPFISSDELAIKKKGSILKLSQTEDASGDKTFLTSSSAVSPRRFSTAQKGAITPKFRSITEKPENFDDEPSLVGFSLDDLDRTDRRQNKNGKTGGMILNLNLLGFMSDAIPEELWSVKEEEDKSTRIAASSPTFFSAKSFRFPSRRSRGERTPSLPSELLQSRSTVCELDGVLNTPDVEGSSSDEENDKSRSGTGDEKNVIQVFRLATGDKKLRRILNLRPDLLNSMRKLYQLHNYTVFIDELRSVESNRKNRSKEQWIADIEKKLREKEALGVDEEEEIFGMSFGKEVKTPSPVSKKKVSSVTWLSSKEEHVSLEVSPFTDDDTSTKRSAPSVAPLEMDKLNFLDDDYDDGTDTLQKEILACGVEFTIKGHLSKADAARRRAGLFSNRKIKNSLYEKFSIVCDNPTASNAAISVSVLAGKLQNLKISSDWKLDPVCGLKRNVRPVSSTVLFEMLPEKHKKKKVEPVSFEGAILFTGHLIKDGILVDEWDDVSNNFQSIPPVSDDLFQETSPDQWGLLGPNPTENAIKNNMVALSILQLGTAKEHEENAAVVNALSTKVGKHKGRKHNTTEKTAKGKTGARRKPPTVTLQGIDFGEETPTGKKTKEVMSSPLSPLTGVQPKDRYSDWNSISKGETNTDGEHSTSKDGDEMAPHGLHNHSPYELLRSGDNHLSHSSAYSSPNLKGKNKASLQGSPKLSSDAEGSSSPSAVKKSVGSPFDKFEKEGADGLSTSLSTVNEAAKRASEANRAAENAAAILAPKKSTEEDGASGVTALSKVSSRRPSAVPKKKKGGKKRKGSLSSTASGKEKEKEKVPFGTSISTSEKKKGGALQMSPSAGQGSPSVLFQGASPNVLSKLPKMSKKDGSPQRDMLKAFTMEASETLTQLINDGLEPIGLDENNQVVVARKDGTLFVYLKDGNLVLAAQVGVSESNTKYMSKEDIIQTLAKQAESEKQAASPSVRRADVWEGGIHLPPTISIISKDSKFFTKDEVNNYASLSGVRFDTVGGESTSSVPFRTSVGSIEGGVEFSPSASQAGHLSTGEKRRSSILSGTRKIKKYTSEEANNFIAEVAKSKRKDRLERGTKKSDGSAKNAIFMLDEKEEGRNPSAPLLNSQSSAPVHFVQSKTSKNLQVFLPAEAGKESEKALQAAVSSKFINPESGKVTLGDVFQASYSMSLTASPTHLHTSLVPSLPNISATSSPAISTTSHLMKNVIPTESSKQKGSLQSPSQEGALKDSEMALLEEQARELYLLDPMHYNNVIDDVLHEAATLLADDGKRESKDVSQNTRLTASEVFRSVMSLEEKMALCQNKAFIRSISLKEKLSFFEEVALSPSISTHDKMTLYGNLLKESVNTVDLLHIYQKISNSDTLPLSEKITLYENIPIVESSPEGVKILSVEGATLEQKQEYYENATLRLWLLQHEKMLLCQQLAANTTLSPAEKLDLFDQVMNKGSPLVKQKLAIYEKLNDNKGNAISEKITVCEQAAQTNILSLNDSYNLYSSLTALGDSPESMLLKVKEQHEEQKNKSKLKTSLSFDPHDVSLYFSVTDQLEFYEKLALNKDLPLKQKSALFEHLLRNRKIPCDEKIKICKRLALSKILSFDEKVALCNAFFSTDSLSTQVKFDFYDELEKCEGFSTKEKVNLLKVFFLNNRSDVAQEIGLRNETLPLEEKESFYRRNGLDDTSDSIELLAKYRSLATDVTLTLGEKAAMYQHIAQTESLSSSDKCALYKQLIGSATIEARQLNELLEQFSEDNFIPMQQKWEMHEVLASDGKLSQKVKTALFLKLEEKDILPRAQKGVDAIGFSPKRKSSLFKKWALDAELPLDERLEAYERLAAHKCFSVSEKSALFEHLLLNERIPIRERMSAYTKLCVEHNVTLQEKKVLYAALECSGSLPLRAKIALYANLAATEGLPLEEKVILYQSILHNELISQNEKVKFIEELALNARLSLKDKLALFRLLVNDVGGVPIETKVSIFKKICADVNTPLTAKFSLFQFIADCTVFPSEEKIFMLTSLEKCLNVPFQDKIMICNEILGMQSFPLDAKLSFIKCLCREEGFSLDVKSALYHAILVDDKMTLYEKLSIFENLVADPEVCREDKWNLCQKLKIDTLFSAQERSMLAEGLALDDWLENLESIVKREKAALYEKMALLSRIMRNKKIPVEEKVALGDSLFSSENAPLMKKAHIYEELSRYEGVSLEEKMGLFEKVAHSKHLSEMEKISIYEKISQLESLSMKEKMSIVEKLVPAKSFTGSNFLQNDDSLSFLFDGISPVPEDILAERLFSEETLQTDGSYGRMSKSGKSFRKDSHEKNGIADLDAIYSSEVRRKSAGEFVPFGDGKISSHGSVEGKENEGTTSVTSVVSNRTPSPFVDSHHGRREISQTKLGSILMGVKWGDIIFRNKFILNKPMQQNTTADSFYLQDDQEVSESFPSTSTWKPHAAAQQVVHIRDDDSANENKVSVCVEGMKEEVEGILFEQMKAKLLLKAVLEKMNKLWNGKTAATGTRKSVEAQKKYKEAQDAAWELGRHRIINLNKLIHLVDRKTGRKGGWLPVYTDDNVFTDTRGFPVYSPVQRNLYRAMNLAKQHRLLPLRLIRRDVQERWNQHLLFGYKKCVIPNSNTSNAKKFQRTAFYRDMQNTGERQRFRRRLLRAAPFQHFSCLFSPRARREVDFPFSTRQLL